MDDYKCPLCNHSFDQLWKLGRHLSTCNQPNKTKETSENVFFRTKILYVEKYRELTHEAAFNLAMKLAKNMSVPRNSVFEVMKYVQIFLTSIGEGMKEVVIPLLKEDKVHEFDDIVSVIINDSFRNVDTEHNLDKCLSDEKLISQLGQVKLENPSILYADQNKSELEESELEESEAETDAEENYEINSDGTDLDDDVDDDIEEDVGYVNDGGHGGKAKTATLMDVHFQIKKFFELPHVFNKIMNNTKKIKKQNKLNHYINGKSWKSKLRNFSEDEIVIPYHLHVDDTQTNNPLGTHTTNGDQTCVYYTFPTIPNKYSARLETIFTALLFESKFSKDYGNEECYKALIDELNKLADQGIDLNVNGRVQKVFFVMGLLLGDNKGLNHCLGFPRGFKAHYYCRHCRLHRKQMQFSCKEDINSLRNRENYDEDLEIGNMKLTGLYENSPFNKIRYFHATDSCADIMHDVNEGILSYNICEVILHFIKKKTFKLTQLNEEKDRIKYGEIEENNRSSKIKMKNLKAKKLKMTASESYAFVHHLPFILLNLTKESEVKIENDDVWQFLLITIRLVIQILYNIFVIVETSLDVYKENSK